MRFREIRYLQLHRAGGKTQRVPAKLTAVGDRQVVQPAPPDPFIQALEIVRSAGVDEDIAEETINRLRLLRMEKQLTNLGFGGLFE